MNTRGLLARTKASNPLPEGTFSVGVGLIVAGITSYGFLVLPAHIVSKSDYAALAALWSLLFLLGPGFFLPLEQEVSRSLAARAAQGLGAGPLVRKAALLGGVLLATLLLVMALTGGYLTDELFDGNVLLLVGLGLGLIGYYVEHLSRGTFSGLGHFRPYSIYLGSEGLLRFGAAVVLAIIGVEAVGPYGLALGLAPLVAAPIAWRGQRGLVVDGPDAPWSELSTALAALLIGSVLAQALMNSPTLAVKVLASNTESGAAADFQAGLVVARIPLFLFQAIQASLLPKLSGLAGSGRIDEFVRGFRRLVVSVAALGILGTATALLIGPWVVQTFFSDEFQLSRRTLGLLAAGSATFMLALAFAQALIALGQHARMALGWVCAMSAFLLALPLSSDLFWRVEVAFLAGSAVGLVVMGVFLLVAIRQGAVVKPGDFVEALHEVPIET